VRCISGGDIGCYMDGEDNDENRLTRPRGVSVSGGSPVESSFPRIQQFHQELWMILWQDRICNTISFKQSKFLYD
jgi:hypothetical protein